MKPLVYIAGPYTKPDPVANVRRAVWIADELVERDLAVPVIPHLTMLWNLVSPAPLEDWYARDLALLEHCHALIRFSGESRGADLECEAAEQRGIPVFGWPDTFVFPERIEKFCREWRR